jgi:hypothetical protein
MARRITIVTAGHLATTPRMVKAADALQQAGYGVRVVSVQHTAWARRYDREMHRRRAWQWHPVEYARAEAPVRWAASGLLFRAAAAAARVAGDAVPLPIAARAFGRVHDLLVGAILREPADLIYGGTTGALAATAEAARRSGTPFAVDFEDFHCGEHDGDGRSEQHNRLADLVMRDVLRDAAFATAGSAAIAGACGERFGRAVTPIHNVFPLPSAPPHRGSRDPVRFYWFSQTIGPGRGLEDVVRAAGSVAVPFELHLQGACANGYVDSLRALAATVAPALGIHVHQPADPDAMVESSSRFTIGLATEPGRTTNNALALSNKALTYPLAGLPVIMTATPGQLPLAEDLGPGALTYSAGDVETLSAGLRQWIHEPRRFAAAQDASWSAARTRWHWEHAEERDTFLASVARVVS